MMKLPKLARRFAFLVLLAVLASCNSGAGGGGTLYYQTDWTNRGSGITGLSQRVNVFDSSEKLIKTAIVNQDTGGLQQATITEVGSGMRHVRVDLFSGRDLQGVQTGELDVWVDIGREASILSGVGESPTQVKVTPAAATFPVQHSRQFYAAGYSLPDKMVFTEIDGFTWEAFGGVATVTEDGAATGIAEGSGTIRATHTDTGLQGGAAITISPFQTEQSKWTVLVYLNGANDLSQFSMLNVDQMETVAGNPANLRFIVQWKQAPDLGFPTWFDGTRRYLIKNNVADGQIDSELIQDMGTGVDMGDPDTLNDFVQWARTYYPGDRFVIVIWNHGNGWLNRDRVPPPTRGVSYDDQTGNYIRTHQLSQALGNDPFDIVAWDASLMQMMEVAYEIKDNALYVVGSEESPPGEGYPYDTIFAKFRDTPDDTTKNLSKAFVDGMLGVGGYVNRKITQSSIETAQLDGLASALDNLAVELIANQASIGADIAWVRDNTKSYSESQAMNRHFRDVVDLCLKIESRLAAFPSIVSAAAAVRAAAAAAVVWEGHNNNSLNSYGVSIDFSKASDFNLNNSTDYALLRFATATQWNEWLQIAP
ncbi:MAG: clostripain-related cysteine peptidase [Fimbriimonadaceae bacterium]